MASAGQRTHWHSRYWSAYWRLRGMGFVQLVEVQWPYNLAVTMCGVAIFIFLCFPRRAKTVQKLVGWSLGVH